MKKQMAIRNKQYFLSIFLLVLLSACSILDVPSTNIFSISTKGTTPPNLKKLTPISTKEVNTSPTLSPLPSLTAPSVSTFLETNTPYPSLTPSVTISPLIRVGPANIPDNINPLTGLPVSDIKLLNRRPIAVKVSNYPHSVRPQFGLSLADIIFEYYLEFGLTRFIGLFFGKDAYMVGPIRSGRLFDEHITRMFGAILVFNSADDKVIEHFMETNLVNRFVVDRNCPPICRDPLFPDPHNLFGNTHSISQFITQRGSDNQKPDLSGMYFNSLEGRSQNSGTEILIRYSYALYNKWIYLEPTQKYIRLQGDQDNLGQGETFVPLMDGLTEQPITADNVVIIFVPHRYYYKSSDTEIIDIMLHKSGRAFVFRNGKAYQAFWYRNDIDKPLTLTTNSGQPFPLKPGVTFFQVMSDGSVYGQSEELWTFEFIPPEEEAN